MTSRLPRQPSERWQPASKIIDRTCEDEWYAVHALAKLAGSVTASPGDEPSSLSDAFDTEPSPSESVAAIIFRLWIPWHHTSFNFYRISHPVTASTIGNKFGAFDHITTERATYCKLPATLRATSPREGSAPAGVPQGEREVANRPKHKLKLKQATMDTKHLPIRILPDE